MTDESLVSDVCNYCSLNASATDTVSTVGSVNGETEIGLLKSKQFHDFKTYIRSDLFYNNCSR